jgi:UDP-glucuronate decarboxylase
MNNPRFHFLEHDIINPLFIDRKIDQYKNLACPASPIHISIMLSDNQSKYYWSNQYAGPGKVHKARILQASTSEVYGDPTEHPQTENYRGNVSCTGIRACYDEGKRVC